MLKHTNIHAEQSESTTQAEVRDHLGGWNGLPSSNVVQFLTEEGALVTARPSGTEPKIKFYFSVKGEWATSEGYDQAWGQLGARIQRLGEDLGVQIQF